MDDAWNWLLKQQPGGRGGGGSLDGDHGVAAQPEANIPVADSSCSNLDESGGSHYRRQRPLLSLPLPRHRRLPMNEDDEDEDDDYDDTEAG